MAHATIPALANDRDTESQGKAAEIPAWAGILTLAVGFVIKYVLFYYRHHDAASFDLYCPRRGWLFLHINGGALALRR